MEKHYYDYLKLLETLWSEARGGDCRSIFFNTEQNSRFSPFVQKVIPHLRPAPRILQAFIQEGTYDPYYPFLDWIVRELREYNPRDLEEFLQNAGVYHYHIPLLQNYILQGRCERYEALIEDELSYEQYRMLQSIWQLFITLFGDQPTLVILENIHLLPSSSFELLDRYLLQARGYPFLFLFSLSRKSRLTSLVEEEYWRRIYDLIQNFSILLDFNIVSTEEGDQPIVYPPATAGMGERLLCAWNSYYLLALRDGRETALQLHRGLYQEEQSLDAEDHCILLQLLGDFHYYLREPDQAYISYHALLKTAQQQGLTGYIIYAYQKIGYIHLSKEDLDTAEKMAQQSLKLANEIQDHKAAFYSWQLFFLIEDKGRRHNIESWQQMFYKVVKQAQKLSMENSLAFFTTNPFGQYSRMDENIENMHKLGVSIARRYNNEFRLAVAYQTMGLVEAVKGNYDQVIRLYRKSKLIKSRLGNPLELSYVHNGLGFYHFMTGSYPQADRNFHKALSLLKKVKDYHEIAMTFFNLAYTYLFSFRHDWAIDYLEKTLYLMDVLQLKNLAYHSLFGIYSTLGVCYCMTGQYSKAYEFWTRIQVMGLAPYTAKNEEYFLFYMLNAFLHAHDNKAGLAVFYFNGAGHYLNKTNDSIKYMGPRYCLEYTRFMKQQGMDDKARSLLEDGLNRSRELRNTYYEKVLQAEMEDQPLPASPFHGRPANIDFDWIIESAKMQNTMTVLHKKYDEIHFLNSFQTLMSQYEGHDLLINKAIDHIHNSFLVDSVYFHIFQNGEWIELYSRHSSQGLLDNNGNTLVNLLTEHPVNQFIPQIDQEERLAALKLWASSLMSFPLITGNKWHGHILCLANKDNHSLTYEDMEVLSLAIRQLVSALEKIDQKRQILLNMQKVNALNKRLQQAAVTDILTKLGNRGALIEKVKSEINRIRRYGDSPRSIFSLLFIDLDNFKYYNDAFGHHVGDMLLVKYSSLLETAAREIDFLARYGGDEFVCVLPETGGDGAIVLAKRIYQLLEEQDNFRHEIEEYLGHPVTVAPDKILSCSIGISVYTAQYEGDAQSIIRDADHALYQAKRQGKGTYTLFTTQ